MKFIKNTLLIVFCLHSLVKSNPIATQAVQAVVQTALAGTTFYGIKMADTLGHEFGHAITGKMLFGDPLRIVVGSQKLSKEHEDLLYMENKKNRFLVNGGQFTGATAFLHRKNKQFDDIKKEVDIKEAAISIAGPVAGIVCDYGILKGMNVVEALKTNSFKEALKAGLKKSALKSNRNLAVTAAAFSSYSQNIKNATFPFMGYDCEHFLSHLGVSNEAQQQILDSRWLAIPLYVPSLYFAKCFHTLYKLKHAASPKGLTLGISLVFCASMFLGY